jgi:hypothetical protein
MAEDGPVLLRCENCNAAYRVIKVDAGPETVDRQVACCVCSASLPGRDGNTVLKYFLTGKPSQGPSRSEVYPVKRVTACRGKGHQNPN